MHLLENKSVVVGETVFWGATLWTDFELNRNPLRSAILAEEGISDYRKIFRDASENRIRAEDIRLLHQASLRCFRSHVATGRSTKSVVVTHHAPSRKSLPPDMEGGDARSLLRLGSRYAGRRAGPVSGSTDILRSAEMGAAVDVAALFWSFHKSAF